MGLVGVMFDTVVPGYDHCLLSSHCSLPSGKSSMILFLAFLKVIHSFHVDFHLRKIMKVSGGGCAMAALLVWQLVIVAGVAAAPPL